jgi:hypothetical protein
MSHLAGTSASRFDSRTPPSRALLGALLLILLGAWGATIPFTGAYFGYGFTPATTWTWTSARFWLEVLPGAVTFFGGLLLLAGARRFGAALAAILAGAAGAWFVVGPTLAPLWDPGTVGRPLGGSTRVALDWIGLYYGVGAVIIAVASGVLARAMMPTPSAHDAGTHRRGVTGIPPAPSVDAYPSDTAGRDTASREGGPAERPAAPSDGTIPGRV